MCCFALRRTTSSTTEERASFPSPKGRDHVTNEAWLFLQKKLKYSTQKGHLTNNMHAILIFFMQAIDSSTWLVPSISGRQPNGYSVKQAMESCNTCTHESLMCTESECKKLCYHMYTCDPYCYEYTNGHICKHIHRVHSLKVQECAPYYQPDAHEFLNSHDKEDEEDSEMDDPLEFAENVRNPSTGTYSTCTYTTIMLIAFL